MITQGKISDPSKKKKKPKAAPEATSVAKGKTENDYVISKSGKPVRKPAKGLTFEDLQTKGKDF